MTRKDNRRCLDLYKTSGSTPIGRHAQWPCSGGQVKFEEMPAILRSLRARALSASPPP